MAKGRQKYWLRLLIFHSRSYLEMFNGKVTADESFSDEHRKVK